MKKENTSNDEGCQDPLPDAGKFALAVWAAKLKMEPRALRENLKKQKIRVLRIGDTWIINAATFWEDLSKNTNDTGGENE